MKQNLQDLGLAFDANKAVPLPKQKVRVSYGHYLLVDVILSFINVCDTVEPHYNKDPAIMKNI